MKKADLKSAFYCCFKSALSFLKFKMMKEGLSEFHRHRQEAVLHLSP